MKTITTRFITLASGLALLALPAAFAGDDGAKFKLMDTDNDGRVTRAEHTAGAKLMFQQADSNGDGILTAAELAATHNSKADSTARESSSTRGDPMAAVNEAADMIKLIDQDGDGKVTRSEHDIGTASMFARMDTNGDGALSAMECDAAHESLKAGANRDGMVNSSSYSRDNASNATAGHDAVQTRPIDK
jgi:hypothetical protein